MKRVIINTENGKITDELLSAYEYGGVYVLELKNYIVEIIPQLIIDEWGNVTTGQATVISVYDKREYEKKPQAIVSNYYPNEPLTGILEKLNNSGGLVISMGRVKPLEV